MDWQVRATEWMNTLCTKCSSSTLCSFFKIFNIIKQLHVLFLSRNVFFNIRSVTQWKQPKTLPWFWCIWVLFSLQMWPLKENFLGHAIAPSVFSFLALIKAYRRTFYGTITVNCYFTIGAFQNNFKRKCTCNHCVLSWNHMKRCHIVIAPCRKWPSGFTLLIRSKESILCQFELLFFVFIIPCFIPHNHFLCSRFYSWTQQLENHVWTLSKLLFDACRTHSVRHVLTWVNHSVLFTAHLVL